MIIDSNQSVHTHFAIVSDGAFLSNQSESILFEKPNKLAESYSLCLFHLSVRGF